VLDIDRERQRISLGLKQTQEDPWQRVVDTYTVGDELEGKVTKVVSFGAFVEILEGVEGLVHISELAQHHVENPREIVAQGDTVKVKILEIDSDRRRLSLSVKRVDGQDLPSREVEGSSGPGPEISESDLRDIPELGLSEDVFAGADAPVMPVGLTADAGAPDDSASTELEDLEDGSAATSGPPEADQPDDAADLGADQPDDVADRPADQPDDVADIGDADQPPPGS